MRRTDGCLLCGEVFGFCVSHEVKCPLSEAFKMYHSKNLALAFFYFFFFFLNDTLNSLTFTFSFFLKVLHQHSPSWHISGLNHVTKNI